VDTTGVKIYWEPHPKQKIALERSEFEIAYGGSRGGGKSACLMAWMIEPQYINNPRYRGLVIRRNYDDLRDYIDRAADMYRHLEVEVVGNPAEFRFKTGAIIRSGHLMDKLAYQKYQGHEYQKMGIEEATLIADEEDYLKLISSCRSTLDLDPQVFLTCNPGGPGHAWFKNRFVDNPREKTYYDDVTGRSRIFIQSRVYDNPTLIEKDPGYLEMLKGLPEELRRAWLDGDWDVYYGQYFSQWRYDVHVCEPFHIPSNWYRYRAIDYGYKAPFAVVWVAVDPNKNVYVYRDYYVAEMELSGHIDAINALSKDEEYRATMGDPSMWIRNPQNTNRSDLAAGSHMAIADLLRKGGINVIKANNDRVSGWNLLREYLKWDDETPPKLHVFKTCNKFIETIPTLVHDLRRPEDLDTKGPDHLADAARYALMHIGQPEKQEVKQWIVKLMDDLRSQKAEVPGVRQ
jgi:phage terminase large subunit